MILPRFGSAPFGFGGPGGPPGFGSAGSSPSAGPSTPATPRRALSGSAPLIIRNPTDDPRLRPFTDVLQEEHNSLVKRGYLVRDAGLNWSIAPNPFAVARDPTAADDASVGVLRGDHWINSANDAVWFCVWSGAGVARWVQLA